MPLVARMPVARSMCFRSLTGPSLRLLRATFGTSAAAQRPAALAPEMVDVAERARQLGVPLTPAEVAGIAAEAGRQGHQNGQVPMGEWDILVQREAFAEAEKLAVVKYAFRANEHFFGQQMLRLASLCGVALFSMAGTLSAAEAGMNVAASAVVACATALGGGTLNDLLMGNLQGGVGWVRNPRPLLIAVGVSVATFFSWPFLERQVAVAKVSDSPSSDNESDEKLKRAMIPYVAESFALGIFCVVGAQQGIHRGLHPVISACAGVTIAFGGIFRDLLCNRDVSIGVGSYAVSSFVGSGMYVAVRALHVRMTDCGQRAIPIGARIMVGMSAAIAMRYLAWHESPSVQWLMLPMRSRSAVCAQ